MLYLSTLSKFYAFDVRIFAPLLQYRPLAHDSWYQALEIGLLLWGSWCGYLCLDQLMLNPLHWSLWLVVDEIIGDVFAFDRILLTGLILSWMCSLWMNLCAWRDRVACNIIHKKGMYQVGENE